MPRKSFKPPVRAEELHLADTQLPIHKPIAIYYRQSTDAQIGNISTTIQTVDMVNYLKRLGWSDDKIIMIDMDAGVSGTKKIDERPGMRMLYSYITGEVVGAVACQDEDRLFRDVTQIQVNIFIEACRASKVLVITPGVVYNFAHPQMGTFHARQFRFKSEMAAEYINAVIKGKLHGAKLSLQLSGKWSGHSISPGFMIDMRQKLPDGSENIHYRKYVPFEPFAEIVKAYFELFIFYSGNLAKILRHITHKGPYFPDPKICLPPEGYRVVYRIKQHGNAWFPGSKPALIDMFTNAAYIGHWVAQGHIVQWNNHPALIEEETFFRAFNYLSSVTLTGEENPDYNPIVTGFRPSKQADRHEAPPILTGLIYAKIGDQWTTVKTHWQNSPKGYAYCLISNDGLRAPIWRKNASYVDSVVSTMLLEKMKVSFDLSEWQAAIDASYEKLREQRRFLQSQMLHLETVMDNLITSLGSLQNPQMIAAVEQRYKAASDERERLQAELSIIEASTADNQKLIDLKASFKETVEKWDQMDSEERHAVAQAFIARIDATQVKKIIIDLVIHWKDGTSDEIRLYRVAPSGTVWLPQQSELLLKLIKSGAGKLELARAFPDFTWRAINNRYRYLTGKALARGKRNTVRQYETYNEYIKRVGIGQTGNTSEVCPPTC